MGAICCHGNQSGTKPNAAYPSTNDALDKIWLGLAHWSQRYHVESVNRCTDGRTDRWTPARLPSYKLTLWAFRSGELITSGDSIFSPDILRLSLFEYYLNLELGKPDFCISKNKGTDQLGSYCAADQRLCFSLPGQYNTSTFKSKISSL